MQQLKTEIVIQIPETHVLIEKTELEELEEKGSSEWISGMNWLSEQTGIISPQQLKSMILYPFRSELENFVTYPNNSGEVWRFNSYYMKQWLRENFKKVVN